jgi:hypothetical protein
MKHLRTISILFVLLGLLAAPVLAAPGDTTRVSLDSSGAQGNNTSAFPDITPDGRYVAFMATASNLVADDTNGVADIFVRDRTLGTTTRVSVATDGTQANGHSYSIGVSISSDGRFVAFYSSATNLAANDTNAQDDIFVRDRDTDTDGIFDEPGAVATILVSMNLSGTDAGNDYSSAPSISADGHYVAFYSGATDLVANDTNAEADVFVRDLQAGTTTRVSVDSSGGQGNYGSYDSSISSDGRYVAFKSNADNLVAVDTNGEGDIFVRDLIAGETTLVSVDSSGAQGDKGSDYPAISSDGRFVAFGSYATNLVAGDTNNQTDVFVRDTVANTTTRISVATDGTQANIWSDHVSISPDGRFVAFDSYATNLVTDDTNGTWDAFVHDRITGATMRVSVDSSGAQANGGSSRPDISSNGSYVAFYSSANNLAANDTNGATDVFVRELTWNSPPTDITLSASSVTENLPSGTTVGTLTSVDPDPADTHNYSFCGGADDASFQIGGAGNDELQTAAVFDYETKNAFNTCIRTDDGISGPFDKAFVINVTDVPGLELLLPLSGASLHYNRPTFDWVDFPSAIGYQIQVAKNITFTQLVSNTTIRTATSNYTPILNLSTNANLFWRVRAKLTLTTYSAWSEIRSLHTANPPGVPFLVSPINNALVTTTPLLNWNNSTLPALTTFDKYEVEISRDNTFATVAARLNVFGLTNSQVTSPVLANANTYYWRVRSWNIDGDYSAWSSVRSVRIAFAGPTLLLPAHSSVVGSLKPTFTWNAIAGATSYTIQISKIITFSPLAINRTVTTPTYTHTLNLTAGTVYYWRVCANGVYGPGTWSVVFSFTTP